MHISHYVYTCAVYDLLMHAIYGIAYVCYTCVLRYVCTSYITLLKYVICDITLMCIIYHSFCMLYMTFWCMLDITLPMYGGHGFTHIWPT